jgi:hypothetical protein
VDTDRTANPGDVRWLQTALDLAMAEREEQAAYAAERDSDHAVLADELLWNSACSLTLDIHERLIL